MGAGPPCQGVSGLNVDRRGALKDHRSNFFPHVARIYDLARRRFPWAQVHRLMDSVVASMDTADREVMSQSVNSAPILIDACRVTGCRRPRLYWPSWELEESAGASISSVSGEGWKRVTEVTLENAYDVEQCLEPGWRKCSQEPFPTFTTSRPRHARPSTRRHSVVQCK